MNGGADEMRHRNKLRGECMIAPARAGEESPNTIGHGGS